MGQHNEPRSQEHKDKIGEALRGLPKSPEHCQHISEAKTGIPQSEELKARKREWSKGEGNPMFGKTHSELTRARLSESHKGTAPRLSKYGVTPERYTLELAAGNRWCWFKRHFTPASKFSSKKGLCADCKTESNRVADLKKMFGLTPEQYEAIFESQGRKCAICGSTKPRRDAKNLPVDHNHKTNSVRGILCGPCNTAIERLETVPDWAARALSYIARYSNMEAANANPGMITVHIPEGYRLMKEAEQRANLRNLVDRETQ